LRVKLIGDGTLKHTIGALIIVLMTLCVVCIQQPAQGRITLWPAKLEIIMESFPNKPIVFKQVQITNLDKEEALVRSEVDYTAEDLIKEGYTFLPNLSWISITPKEMVIPAKSYGFFNITITIPEINQSQSYNQKWEAMAVFYQVKKSNPGSVNFLVKLGSRIFIDTPINDENKQQTTPNLFVIIWFGGMIGLAIATIVFYLRGRYSKYKQKAAVYYIKDKDFKHLNKK